MAKPEYATIADSQFLALEAIAPIGYKNLGYDNLQDTAVSAVGAE
jgi:hypothetical protein